MVYREERQTGKGRIERLGRRSGPRKKGRSEGREGQGHGKESESILPITAELSAFPANLPPFLSFFPFSHPFLPFFLSSSLASFESQPPRFCRR